MDINVIYYTKLALYTILVISIPIMSASFIIGLLVGIFQALTQIQDQTFSFVVKLLGIMIVLGLSTVWVGNEIRNFMDSIYSIQAIK
jgi:type III secretion HrpO family protein